MTSDTIPVSRIKVGQRARKVMPNAGPLVASIKRLGLLQPLVVNSADELVCGHRRLEAVKALGWELVQVRRVFELDDVVKALEAERDENTCREPLTPTELVALGRQLEKAIRDEARERQHRGRPPAGTSGQRPEVISRGDTRDKVADAIGSSGTTYERAKRVVEAAEEDPERFGDLLLMMDEESVNAAYEELKERQQSQSGEGSDKGGEKRKTPKFFRPGSKVDPDHPHAALLSKITALAGAVSAAMNAPGGDRLKTYLTHVRLVDHVKKLVPGGKGKKPRYVGLRDLYRVVKLAGKRGKEKTAEQIQRELEKTEDES